MRNILIGLGVIAVVLIVGVGLYQWRGGPEVPQAAQPATAAVGATAPSPATAGVDATKAAQIRADDYVIGASTAPVTIIEYASLTCPHCRTFHETVLPELKKAYIDTGKVRLAFRDFPLDGRALRAAMLARCAGKESYFGFLDLLFKRQMAWATAPDPTPVLSQIAALGGIDAKGFAACLNNPKIEKQVLEQRLEAEKAFAIDSTPSFIINGKKISGGPGLANFKVILDPLLAKAGK